jgi:hypothetical protein
MWSWDCIRQKIEAIGQTHDTNHRDMVGGTKVRVKGGLFGKSVVGVQSWGSYVNATASVE